MTDTDDLVHVIGEDECWTLLEGDSFGRLAYAVGPYPEIVPINYCARDGAVWFRTAGGTKLFGLTVNPNVTFEIDRIDGEVATSVIVHGVARQVESPQELEIAESLPLRPWIPTDKVNYVRIEADEVTGRRFTFGPEGEDAPSDVTD